MHKVQPIPKVGTFVYPTEATKYSGGITVYWINIVWSDGRQHLTTKWQPDMFSDASVFISGI